MFDFAAYKLFLKEYEMVEFKERSLRRRLRSFPVPYELQRQLALDLPAQYRQELPVYELAVCPLCGGSVKEGVDTFSLAGIGWRNDGPDGFGWYGRMLKKPGYAHLLLQEDGWPQPSYQASCPHVQGMTYGVYLHDIYPNDTRQFVEIGGEQPGVLRPFIEQEDCTAVLRILPIGRRDDDEWQPRYTAWFLTYFSPTPAPFRTILPSADMTMKASGFYWPYHLLTHDLQPLIADGKVVEMPENEMAWDQLQGLNGRWGIAINRLLLMPEKLWGNVWDRKHPTYFGLDEKAEKLLATRHLAAEPLFMERFAQRLTQFITHTADWKNQLPFESRETFMHPIHRGLWWTLSLTAEGEKVRLNFYMQRAYQDKPRITRPIFLGTAVELTDSLPQITEEIINLADPQGMRIMYQTLIDYAAFT